MKSADDHFCVIHIDQEDEEACMATESIVTISSYCDYDENTNKLVEVAAAFSILAFLVSFSVAVKIFLFSSESTGVKSSSSNPSSANF